MNTRDHVAEGLLILGLFPTVLQGGTGMPEQYYHALVEHLTKALQQLDSAKLDGCCPDCGRPRNLPTQEEYDRLRIVPAPEGWNPDDSTVNQLAP